MDMTPHFPIYLDYGATTPVDPRVVDAMIPWLREHFGNAASRSHAWGWEAEEAIEKAVGREGIGAFDAKRKPDAIRGNGGRVRGGGHQAELHWAILQVNVPVGNEDGREAQLGDVEVPGGREGGGDNADIFELCDLHGSSMPGGS